MNCHCGCHAFDDAPHRQKCEACGHDGLDTDQALELMLNGWMTLDPSKLDWACASVAESHGHPRDGDYFRRLRSATAQRLEYEEL